jgi:elongator complex protein 3
MERDQAWLEARDYTSEQIRQASKILDEVIEGRDVLEAIRGNPLPSGGYVGKPIIVQVYRHLVEKGEIEEDPSLLSRIRMKPGRTLSGVTTVTVLTKPYPCPGECIFCPLDSRVPKSYLPDEPGAMRAVHHGFDPFAQTSARIEALDSIGHPTDKIELLVLGGTWSAYTADYQEWFLKRCLDVMNGFEAKSLQEAQTANATARHRNVGLVIETRPDSIDRAEIARLRALSVTKVQMGSQSQDDRILALNKRGHSVEATRQAMGLLRAAGFKTVLHWMPNLLGATLESDAEDFARLWDDPGLRPDEIKIYPCQLLENTGLYQLWERGEYTPYTTEELVALIAKIKPLIPRYCRVNRVVRDIPSDNIVAGNKRTSLRQDIQRELKRRGERCQCIRCREVRGRRIDTDRVEFQDQIYQAGGAEEHFLSIVTSNDRLAGYLRLSLPGTSSADTGLSELANCALVRELHIYGQSLEVGENAEGAAQHAGLGMDLMQRAEAIAHQEGYNNIAVIAALGTRGYYQKMDYELAGTYMIKEIR